jgi:signal transduction histidine kinase
MSNEQAAPGKTPPSAKEIERLERKLHVVQDVATALGSTLDLDTLLYAIMAKTTAVLDADRSTLYLHDEDRGEIWSKVTQGGEIQEIRLRIPEGIAGWVAQTGETLNIPDAYQDDRFNPEVDRRSGYRTRSMLTMPMVNTHGQVVGVVQVLNKSGGAPFDAEDEELLRALTAQAAVSIENSKLYRSLVKQNEELRATQEKLEQRMSELDLLYQIEQESLGADDLDDLLDRLNLKAMELVCAQAASTVMVTADRAELHFSAASGPKGHQVRTLRVPRGTGFAGWVVDHNEPLLINDVASDPRHNRALAETIGYIPRTMLCVPIRGEDGVLGALELLDRATPDTREVFDDNDLKLASLIAGHMAKVIQLARAQETRIKEGRLAAIGQMLSGVVHDLKTPMTIAGGYAQLLPSVDAKHQREEYGQEILRQFQLMEAMTREVLAFARGDTQVLIRKVYLHRFFADVREHLIKDFEGKGIELRLETPYQGLAWFDEIKIRRVITNMSSNAARAMPEGGTFTVWCDRQGDQLVLRFSDTGVGIPEDMEGRLFELFATSGHADGTGLGLAIVKKIVTEHEGTITYETERGHGTTFTVVLPFPADQAGQSGQSGPSGPAGSSGEDEPGDLWDEISKVV